jgi:methionine-S-sulfoxide reductase
MKKTIRKKYQMIYLAGGCFWHIEEEMRKLNGVKQTSVGFMGGTTHNPTYKQVCSGDTGHAETVEVKYDKNIISCERLIDFFMKIHDPTTLNRPGNDIGTQYRSVIFYTSEKQKRISLSIIDRLSEKMKVVTEVVKSSIFYKAEEYHQKYIQKQKGGKSEKMKRKTKKREFLYNPKDPKKSFDVYIDKDPSDTIHIKYTSIKDVENTIKKLERLYKRGKYPHKRIWQVGMIMKVRLEVLKKKKKEQYKLSKRYFEHLGKRTKIKGEQKRTRFKFKI